MCGRGSGKECEESGALSRTRFARAVAALLRFTRLLVNSNVRLLLRRKRLETLKGGCKFELIVRIPKVYSCIFQADFPSLRAVGACEPLLEKQNITKQKTLCGVRASELLRCTKFVQVGLIFTKFPKLSVNQNKSKNLVPVLLQQEFITSNFGILP